MRLLILLSVAFLLLNAVCKAQHDNVWAFGGNAGLDFNVHPPAPILTSMGSRESCASICDTNGNLLFYTNGTFVWNRNHLLMNNGNPIIPLSPQGTMQTESTQQGSMIIPFPFDNTKYYLFSITSAEYAPCKLFYTVINMELNNGLGGVDQSGIVLDSFVSERLSSTIGNHCNIWLLTTSYEGGISKLKAYEITIEGIDPVAIESNIPYLPGFSGQIRINKQRSKLALTQVGMFGGGYNGLYLFDFNANNGMVSNPIQLSPIYPGCGVEFSPDGSKIYAHTAGGNKTIYQYDLSAGNTNAIIASRYQVTSTSSTIVQIKLGPDGKIYTGDNLSVIHNPNLPGALCNFESGLYEFLPGSNASIGGNNLPNVVTVLKVDTSNTSQFVEGDCFRVLIKARNDSSGWDYVWNTGELGSELHANTPGMYWVKYYSPSCTLNIDSIRVSLKGIVPLIHVSPECKGKNNGMAFASTYPEDPVRYNYTWLAGDDTLSISDTLPSVASGNYRLHVLTDTGCDTMLFFQIPEEDFTVSLFASDTLICIGDTLHFTNTSDTHFTSFYWNMDNGDHSLSTPTGYRYTSSGSYQVMLAGAGNICKDTTYQTILVDAPITPDFELHPREICVGQPVSLSPFTDSTTTYLKWELADRKRVEAAVQSRYQHAFDQSGVFPITLNIQSRACPDTGKTDSITVYPFPEVDLGGDSSICLHGSPVYLKNLRPAPLTPYHQIWSTGDTTEVLKVVHPGVYTLTLTTEPLGCTTTESIAITKDCYIAIPNAFTPNGDGHNDYFFPRQWLSESINRFHMQVINRWGQVVFETNRLDGRGWDGKFNDKAQPMGVYLYRIEAEFINGRVESYEGNVTLVR